MCESMSREPRKSEADHKTQRYLPLCSIDDQACLHAALQSGAFFEQPHHARLDIGGEVLLNTYKLNKGHPTRVGMGASLLQYFPVGALTRANYMNHTTPCVLHFNGKLKGFMSMVALGVAAGAWIVDLKLNVSAQRQRDDGSARIHRNNHLCVSAGR